MSDTDYRSIDAMNWSTLTHLAVSPKLFRWRQEHGREDTPALLLGRAIHCAILEPERWGRDYVARPYFGDGRTKAAKAAKADFLAGLAPGTEVLSADEYELAERVAEEVRAHPVARALLAEGRTEEVITWTDEETGVPCKGRLDLIAPTFVLDVKTTRMPTLWRIASDAASYRYHGQLAFYFDGAIAARAIPHDAELPRILAVQTVEPFDVIPTHLGAEFLERGRAHYRELLRLYLECKAADWWPGIAPQPVELPMPPWAAGAGRAADTHDEEDW